MARRASLTGLLAVLVFACCDGRELLDGISWTSLRGTGGAAMSHDDGGAAAGTMGRPSQGGGGGAVGSGTGGRATSGDAGLEGGTPTCGELAALYVDAVEEDKSCDPASAEPQCQLRVIPALCGSCPASTYVNSRAASTAARLRWDMVPCPVSANCNTTCGPLPTEGRCVSGPNQSGRCVDVFP